MQSNSIVVTAISDLFRLYLNRNNSCLYRLARHFRSNWQAVLSRCELGYNYPVQQLDTATH